MIRFSHLDPRRSPGSLTIFAAIRGGLHVDPQFDLRRLKIAWPNSTSRIFGRFHTQAEPEKWIVQHRWPPSSARKPTISKPTTTVERLFCTCMDWHRGGGSVNDEAAN